MDAHIVITKTNTKGQVVIPSTIRHALGIKNNSQLLVSLEGGKILMSPIKEELKGKYNKSTYLKILAKTAGAFQNTKSFSKRVGAVEKARTAKNKSAW
jgi:AbrB family looped-hinge helix DNA binding protein